ncbi:MAG: elongation factor P [Chloroflexota bacterium]|nr:elongation factor P [Chloroflexota bacterium]
MIDVNELRKGTTFEINDTLYKVLEYSHHKPGRGKAIIRTKIRDLRTGKIIQKNFSSSDSVQDIHLDYRSVQYLYADDRFYYFMDMKTYEQPAIRKDVIAEAIRYLKENMEVKLTLYGSEALDIDLPTTVDMEVTWAEPAVRGDTATGLTKKVTTENDFEVEVPAFVEKGDTIRVDTRDGSYVTRV